METEINKMKQYPKITLREKPISNGNKTLILDCYFGNKSLLPSEDNRTRVRHHLGLHIFAETTPERKTWNKQVLEKAAQILASKEAEAKKLCDEDRFSFSQLFPTNNNDQARINTYSVRLRFRALSKKRRSLYLDFYIGEDSLVFQDTIITGRQKYYLNQYLEAENSKAAKESNKNVLKAAVVVLESAISEIEEFIQNSSQRIAISSNIEDFL